MRECRVRSYRLPIYALLFNLTMWAPGCAVQAIDRTIQVGKTTKTDVIAQYGEPDLVLSEQQDEVAIYWPASGQRVPVQVPTVQPGPFGTSSTQMQTIEPGLGKEAKAYRRPQKETRIRYNAQGIVQEVIE